MADFYETNAKIIAIHCLSRDKHPLASCPGSRGGGEREPGTHRSRMRLIISNFCRFLRHRRLPTAMIRNNLNKLAAKLLSFVGLY